MTTPPTFWLPESPPSEVDCICIGTGRFLRSVLMPPLVAAGWNPVLIQTRGTAFLEFMHTQPAASYPVDVVQYDGTIETEQIQCYGAFSWGSVEHKRAVEEEVYSKMKRCVLVCWFLCSFLKGFLGAHIYSFLPINMDLPIIIIIIICQ